MLIVVLCGVVSESYGSESFDGQTFYFGDLHAHTGISPDGGSSDSGYPCPDEDPDDGIDSICGSLADVFDAARDTYHLDFVAFTDHTAPDAQVDLFYELLQRGLDETSSTFVVIPGAERSVRYTETGDVGHKTNLVFQDDVDLLQTLDLLDFGGDSYGQTKRFATCADVWTHPAAMAAEFGPTLEFAHHPATLFPMATDWTCHDQTYQPVVEVYSGFGNSLRVDDYDQPTYPSPDKMVHEALETYGLRVGFVGGTDIHDTRPGEVCGIQSWTDYTGTHVYGGGLTIVALPEGGAFERSTIYEELVARRSLVTTGPEMPVSVHWITSDNTSHVIGEELLVHESANEATTLSVRFPPSWDAFVLGVRAVGYATSFDLAEEAVGEWSVPIPNDELPTWLYAEVALDGAAYYGAPGACLDELLDSDGDGVEDPIDDREFVWSSPAWFDFSTDVDGDSFAYDIDDCNDYDAAIHPHAPEIPNNGIDENCNGVDSDRYDDVDGDGYSYDTGDCDDDDAAIGPDAEEVWYDGVDQDCDGNDFDQDWDGFPYDVDDCDDEDAAIHPDAEEVWYDGVDQNCDGNDLDQDWDGVAWPSDCDDQEAARYPGATEIPSNGIDEDCDGVDSDGDSDGDGYTYDTGDCNDDDAAISPDVEEVWYDGVDQNCDGNDLDQDWDGFPYGVDDCDDDDAAIHADAEEVWYDGVDQNCDGNDLDQDWDGVAWPSDCADDDAAVHPGANEVWYDGVDQNCDGNDLDQDGDGYAIPSDCNDLRRRINPGARDIPRNGVDENCDGRR